MARNRRPRRPGHRAHRHRPPRPAQPGLAPGTILPDPAAPDSIIRVMAYGQDGVVEERIEDPGRLALFVGRYPVTWISVEGLGSIEKITAIADQLQIHRLALEDVVNLDQRPKVEEYEHQVFLAVRIPISSIHAGTEQLGMFLGDDYLLTFHETESADLEPIRERIRQGRIRLTSGRPDYLGYSILDMVVDSYFPLLEHYGDELERLEHRAVERADPATVPDLHALQRDLMWLRRIVWPLRELLNTLLQEEHRFWHPETRIYLRDCYDHANRLLDTLESYRDFGTSLANLSLSLASHRMNEIMKVLTIIATIFIPLSFIASLYGMNFDTSASRWNMPELHWRWGYPFALGLMAGVAALLLLFFRRRGWLGGKGAPPENGNGPPAG